MLDAGGLYLDLLEDCLLGMIYEDVSDDAWSPKTFDPQRRSSGKDWPSRAHTMIGKARMRNIRQSAFHVVGRGVPGDFVETGVWRGGACIYMRGILRALGSTDRVVWAADSFDGLPPPNAVKYPADAPSGLHEFHQLAVSLDEVKANFSKYGLLDDQVRFLRGWFRDTLPVAPIEQISVLRLDGDLYESTMDALTALYDKVSPGGVVIVDDYNIVPCRQAVADYRTARNIKAPIQEIDGMGVYWVKG
jgi:hypothetical protein